MVSRTRVRTLARARPLYGEANPLECRERALSPLLRLLEELLASDRRGSAGTVALGAEPSAARKSRRYAAAALADGALVISRLNGSWHPPEYGGQLHAPGARTA